MKKLFSMVIILLFVLCGCDTYAFSNTYPYDVESAWYCEEVDLLLDYQSSETGQMITEGYTMNLDGQKLKVEVLFHSQYFAIYLDDDEKVAPEDDKLLEGTWEYQDGNLVMYISDDYLSKTPFSKLVFVPQS